MTKSKKKPARKKKNAGGRPSEYRRTYCEQVEKLLALGATNEKVAEFFEVSVSALKRWMKSHPEFRTAMRVGRIRADAEIADSLFQRAKGYRHKATKILQYEGKVITVPYTEVYPPDTQAIKFWLTNRQPRLWRDKISMDVREGGLADRLKTARERVGRKESRSK